MKSLKPDLLSFEITQETHFNIQQAEAEQFDSIRECVDLQLKERKWES